LLLLLLTDHFLLRLHGHLLLILLLLLPLLHPCNP
jgi:hypothetical protein